jgi:hypothetical protein
VVPIIGTGTDGERELVMARGGMPGELREVDAERVKKGDGTVLKAHELAIDSHHLDHGYRLERADGIRAETGLPEVLRLVRRDDSPHARLLGCVY